MTEQGAAKMKAEVTYCAPTHENEHYARADDLLEQIIEVDLNVLVGDLSHKVDTMGSAFALKSTGPAEAEIEFAVKLSGEGSLVLAKVGGEMTMKVRLLWKR